ncbi:SDR family oxidoreductase [Mycolicibacter heraklionensis]|uniref:SDR family oxidoreductase n=1 Tax=Mycolicibacter heraklionensis TaxID=512402 RepID=A0A9X7WDG3_9MYCO|nr:SDR family oxidoreductase [Mycolicibacter heraklionensis]QZA06203.1 SDR family oxidoreductase [Mycolicibacter heraklionensis]
MTTQDFAGRTAVITGGSRGIGLAIGQRLAEAGANVVLTSRDQESADAAAAQVQGNALGVAAHVADDDAAQRCIDLTLERFGSIDVLVNNAGTNPAFGPLIDQDHARFAKIFDINLWGPLLWTSCAVKAWMGEHSGVVVNTASIGGMSFAPLMGMYNATKAALIHVTKQLALELSPGIRVNAICPGVVRTKLAEVLWKEHEQGLSGAIPLGRIGEPGDVADAVLFLASDAASWITGQTLVMDGGQILGDATGFRAGLGG